MVDEQCNPSTKSVPLEIHPFPLNSLMRTYFNLCKTMYKFSIISLLNKTLIIVFFLITKRKR